MKVKARTEYSLTIVCSGAFTCENTPRRTFRRLGETKATNNAGFLDLIH